ncbi:MAG: hypothetical protein U0452_15870 [Anaerolineae bacterium]
MSAVKDWQADIDAADQVGSLRVVLHDLASAISDLEDSPYADEDAVRDQLHDLELVREHGERKLDRLLD